MLKLASQPTTAHDVIRQLAARYDGLIATGECQPFLYPWGTLGAAAVIAYLLVDHRHSQTLSRCRYLAFAFICAVAGHSISKERARNPAAAFGVGLIGGWSVLWCAVMLIFSDAQKDFKRIERREKSLDVGGEGLVGQSTAVAKDGATRQRANGHIEQTQASTSSGQNGHLGTTQTPNQRTGSFAWQTYPVSPFLERLDWVADVFCNFRGMGWNWRTSGIPPPPLSVQQDLQRNNGASISSASTHVSHTGVHRHHTTSTLLRENFYIFARNYLILDLLKTLIAHDPYFWGIVDSDTTSAHWPGYLPQILRSSPMAVRGARLLISLAAIKYALELVFSLGPLFFVGVLGPNVLGARGEPWMYPASFGAYSAVLDNGLGGWWGGWWHQTFRFAFEEAGRAAVRALRLEPRSVGAKLVALATAFTLSGCLHACGSFTQIGDTRPLRGPFCFFVLQIGGVAAQMGAAAALRRVGVTQWLPRWVRRVGNFAYVHVWFYFTAGLLCDDFARGGIWLFEPLPLSLLRGLGFGVAEDGWWCWSGQVVRWVSGSHWWNSGLGL